MKSTFKGLSSDGYGHYGASNVKRYVGFDNTDVYSGPKKPS